MSSQTPIADLKITVKATDMDEDYMRKLNEVVASALSQFKQEKHIAHHIKNEFDKYGGYSWNCVVGRGFGSHIKHQTKKYVFFCIRDLHILLWKS